MNKKERICRLEAKVQKIIKDKSQISAVHMYGSSPSEEEKKIALNKLKELNLGSSKKEICFIPYKFIDDFQCYFKKSSNIEWDRGCAVGVHRVNNTVYKLVEKYAEKWAFTGSDVQPVIVSNLEE